MSYKAIIMRIVELKLYTSITCSCDDVSLIAQLISWFSMWSVPYLLTDVARIRNWHPRTLSTASQANNVVGQAADKPMNPTPGKTVLHSEPTEAQIK